MSGMIASVFMGVIVMYYDVLIVLSKLSWDEVLAKLEEDHGVNVNVCRNKERKRNYDNICVVLTSYAAPTANIAL